MKPGKKGSKSFREITGSSLFTEMRRSSVRAMDKIETLIPRKSVSSWSLAKKGILAGKDEQNGPDTANASVSVYLSGVLNA